MKKKLNGIRLNLKILISILIFNNLNCYFYKIIFTEILKDSIEINKNLISKDNLKICLIISPFYFTSLYIDKYINYLFYDKNLNSNIRQITDLKFYNFDISNILLTNSILTTTCYVLSNNLKYNIIGTELFLGLFFMGITKNIVKLFKWSKSIRPLNHNFTKKNIYYGGFPSGHLATISYISYIWYNQFGYESSLPLFFTFGYTFFDYLIKNRHYLSQILAGIGLGLIYGNTINKIIKKKLFYYNLNKVNCFRYKLNYNKLEFNYLF